MSSGEGKPPKNYQSKKGQSKKPSQPESRTYLFRKASETVVVQTAASGKMRIDLLGALARMVQNLALNGDPGAARLLSQMRKNSPVKRPLPTSLSWSAPTAI